MRKITKIAKEIRELRGKTVPIFGQPVKLDSKLEKGIVDIIDILNELADYELSIEELEEFGASGLDAYDIVEELERMGYIEYDGADNSYNYGGNLSNEIDITFYNIIDTNETLVLAKIHRYGDVRANYTEPILLKFDYKDEFYQCIFEAGYKTEIVELNDKVFYTTFTALSDEVEIYTEEDDKVYFAYGYYGDIVEYIENNLI